MQMDGQVAIIYICLLFLFVWIALTIMTRR